MTEACAPVHTEEAVRARAEQITGQEFSRGSARAGRHSTVVVRGERVLKIMDSERCRREVAGLRAASAGGLRVPEVIAHSAGDGLAWVVLSRLGGRALGYGGDAATAVLLGCVAARLHTVAGEQVDQLPRHKTGRLRMPRGTTRVHAALERLDREMRRWDDAEYCGRGLVYGGWLARHVRVSEVEGPGVLDFGACRQGCSAIDLAGLVLHEGLLAGRSIPQLLSAYECAVKREGITPVNGAHLAWHVAVSARRAIQHALETDDHGMGLKIHDATPWICRALRDPAVLAR